MERDNGGPAFPVNEVCDHNGDIVSYAAPGMTLRDYFAAKAMQGMLCNGFAPAMTQDDPVLPHFNYARHAYAMADAMLAERSK